MVLHKTLFVLLLVYTFALEDYKIQDEYELILERSSFTYYNKKYVHTAKAVSFRYNRTKMGINISLGFSFDINRDLYVITQAYRFASNEYRQFPLRVGTKFCEVFGGNLGGLQLMPDCGNFTTCAFKKGETYAVCNYFPDGTKFFPHVPSGKYKFQLSGSYEETQLFVMQSYIEIRRPEVRNYKSFLSTR